MEESMDMEGPIIKIVNGILIKAIKLGASDIHFEPYERTFRVRYRIDGVHETGHVASYPRLKMQ